VVACLALAFGILAFVPLGIAATHARGAGVGGDDWTAFLAGAAGTVLVGLGALILWRTRKPTGRRYLRRSLEALAGLLVVFWVLFPLGLAYGATHRPRATEPVADLGRPVEDVRLETTDGLELAAWYVPPENGAAIVLFPTRKGSADHARMLMENGYGVLAVDMRGYDGSEGDPNAFGWGGEKDLDAAIAFLESRPEVDDGAIGGLGLSVGGEELLQASAENDGLAAVVSEGAGIRSVREAAALGASGLPVLPQYLVQTAAVALLSGEPPPPSLVDLSARISPRAAFFIHAAEGQGGEELTEDYYDAAGDPKELWRTESTHTGGLDADPKEYEQRVVAFFDETLLGGR
jgi:dienelactone hydrolase